MAMTGGSGRGGHSMQRRLRGRAAELAHLTGIVDEAGRGIGGAALVLGEAGAGKTTLLDELVGYARARAHAVARANADEIDSMAPLSTLLRALVGTTPSILRPGEITALRTQAGTGRAVVRDVQSVLERVAGGTPILIAIDDVDTADDLTVHAVRFLVRELASSPVTWLLTARPTTGSTMSKLRSAV